MRPWFCLTTLVLGLAILGLVYASVVARIIWDDDHGPDSAPSLAPNVGIGAIAIVLILLSVVGLALSLAARNAGSDAGRDAPATTRPAAAMHRTSKNH